MREAVKLLAGTRKHSDRPRISADPHQFGAPGIVDDSGQLCECFWPIAPMLSAGRHLSIARSNAALQQLFGVLSTPFGQGQWRHWGHREKLKVGQLGFG